jgi:hypothetical protein
MALWHHFVLRDGTLARMSPVRRYRGPSSEREGENQIVTRIIGADGISPAAYRSSMNRFATR